MQSFPLPQRWSVALLAMLVWWASLAWGQGVGSLEVNVLGLPTGTAARLTLSSDKLARPTTLTQGGRIENLVPGNYTLVAEAVQGGGLTYQPTPLRQSFEVKEGSNLVVRVAYLAPPGSLRITIEGLPAGVVGQLVLSGPGDYRRDLETTGNLTLNNLPSGDYVLSGVSGSEYEPSVPQQTITVQPARLAQTRVTFAQSRGRLLLTLTGLPPGLAAPLTLSGGSAPVSLNLLDENRLNLLKGTYNLAAPVIYFMGKAYGPLQASQSAEVVAGKEVRLEVAYQLLAMSSLRLELSGLTRGQVAELLLQGPDGFRLELGLEGPETLLDLLPGEYRLGSSTGGLVVRPLTFSLLPGQTGTQVVSVSAGIPSGASLAASVEAGSVVRAVAFAPRGNLLAVALADGNVQLWDAQARKLLGNLGSHPGGALALRFSPDGALLASGGADNLVKIWRVTTRELVTNLEGPRSSVNVLAFNPEGSRLAAGSGDRVIYLWEIPGGARLAPLEGAGEGITALEFARDNRTLFSGGTDGRVLRWELGRSSPVATIGSHTARVSGVGNLPERNLVISSSADGVIRLWSSGLPSNLTGHRGAITGLVYTPDGQLLATISTDKTLRLWDLASRTARATLETTSEPTSLSLSPDGQWLAVGGGDGKVQLWQVIYR
jgi:WD40 repeat protein